MDFKLEETTIGAIQSAYLDGTLTCVQLVQAYLERIAAFDQTGPSLNAFVKVNPAALEDRWHCRAMYLSMTPPLSPR